MTNNKDVLAFLNKNTVSLVSI